MQTKAKNAKNAKKAKVVVINKKMEQSAKSANRIGIQK